MNAPATKSRILVVEDEAIVAADIKDRLVALGYEVIGPVDNGIEAIEKAVELRPDLVLMDIMLKGELMGTDAASQIRTELHIPVIYLTANSNEATFAKARDTEPFGFILKPFEETVLKGNIEIALYKHRMEREREILIGQLHEALAKVKTLTGLIPICPWCKNVRSDKGFWQGVEQYVRDHSDATVSSAICPGCQVKIVVKSPAPPEA
jgi:two-component system, response regulator PdtaR